MIVKRILGEVEREPEEKDYKSQFLMVVKGNKNSTFKIFIKGTKHYVAMAYRDKYGKIIGYKRCSNYFDKFEDAVSYRKKLIKESEESCDYLTIDFLYSIYDYENPLNDFQRKNYIVIKERV